MSPDAPHSRLACVVTAPLPLTACDVGSATRSLKPVFVGTRRTFGDFSTDVSSLFFIHCDGEAVPAVTRHCVRYWRCALLERRRGIAHTSDIGLAASRWLLRMRPSTSTGIVASCQADRLRSKLIVLRRLSIRMRNST